NRQRDRRGKRAGRRLQEKEDPEHVRDSDEDRERSDDRQVLVPVMPDRVLAHAAKAGDEHLEEALSLRGLLLAVAAREEREDDREDEEKEQRHERGVRNPRLLPVGKEERGLSGRELVDGRLPED